MSERFEKKLDKLISQQQGSSNLPGGVLGLLPNHWFEAVDANHRYGSCLLPYWQRWEVSETKVDFFSWLDEEEGKLIDLPLPGYPRRFLQEWKVWYLTKQEQTLFEVEIVNGRFVWTADFTPVTVPRLPDHVPVSERERYIARQMQSRQAVTRERNSLLAIARQLVAAAMRDSLPERVRLRDLTMTWLEGAFDLGGDETFEAKNAQARYAYHNTDDDKLTLIDFIAQPLIEEDLIRQLRDPMFKYRTEHQYRFPGVQLPEEYYTMKELPHTLLPNVTWQSFLTALSHEQDSRITGNPPPKGIFVVDSQGRIFCGTKLRGVFHHTSFVRGHGVLCAGSVTIKDGALRKFTPHSGHYTPRAKDVQRLVHDWEAKGINIHEAEFKGYDKS